MGGCSPPSPPVCATAYTVGALTAWKHNAQPTDEPLKSATMKLGIRILKAIGVQ